MIIRSLKYISFSFSYQKATSRIPWTAQPMLGKQYLLKGLLLEMSNLAFPILRCLLPWLFCGVVFMDA